MFSLLCGSSWVTVGLKNNEPCYFYGFLVQKLEEKDSQQLSGNRQYDFRAGSVIEHNGEAHRQYCDVIQFPI